LFAQDRPLNRGCDKSRSTTLFEQKEWATGVNIADYEPMYAGYITIDLIRYPSTECCVSNWHPDMDFASKGNDLVTDML
jgi:hypothetical protein